MEHKMVRKHYDRQFKLSAARLVLEGEHPIVELSEMLGISSNSLRRWAIEYQKDGESAFSGNGNPRINKDYEILKLKKQVEELEMENEMLKNFRAFLKQSSSRGSSS